MPDPELDKTAITNKFLRETTRDNKHFIHIAASYMYKENKNLLDVLNEHFLLTNQGTLHYRDALSLPDQQGINFTKDNINLEELEKIIDFQKFLNTSASVSAINKEQSSRFLTNLNTQLMNNKIPEDEKSLNLLGNKLIIIFAKFREDQEFKHRQSVHALTSNPTIQESIHQAALADKQMAVTVLAMRKDYKLLNYEQTVDVLAQHIHDKNFEKKVFPFFSAISHASINLKALAKIDKKAFEKILETPELLKRLGKKDAIEIAKIHINKHYEVIEDRSTNKNPLQQTIFEEINKMQAHLKLLYDKFTDIKTMVELSKNPNFHESSQQHLEIAVALVSDLFDSLQSNEYKDSPLTKEFKQYLEHKDNRGLKEAIINSTQKNSQQDIDINRFLNNPNFNLGRFSK